MLISKIRKHKKHKIKQNINRIYYFNNLNFGAYGLKLLNSCLLSDKHIEVAKNLIIKRTLKTSLLWIRNFSNYNKTKKANKIRMGKGKGKIFIWVSRIYKGNILIELDNMPFIFAKALLYSTSYKLPSACKITKKKSIIFNNTWATKLIVQKYYKK